MAINFTKPTPLYIQIVEHIHSQVESGAYKSGDRIGSHHELAKVYNVSLITVKKALSKLITDKVLFSRVGKGTYVAEKPKTIDLGKGISIGLVLRNLDSPFFARIVESVERAASHTGCNLLVSTSANSRVNETTQIKNYLELGVSGLILTSITTETHVSLLVRDLHARSFPYVVVAYTEDEDINYIGVDQEYGARMATEHLIRLGYKNIGYINSESGYKLGEVRRQGYLKALKIADLKADNKQHYHLGHRGGWHEYESGYDIGRQIAAQSDLPQAMFVYNDLAALGFEKGLMDNNIRVPEDVAIIGFDNIKRGVVCPVPLTTVHQPTNEIGSLAMRMVDDLIKGTATRTRIILRPRLVIRESCGARYLEKKQPEQILRTSDTLS